MKNLITLTSGDRLRIFRKLNGMEQWQLAEAIGRPQSKIQSLEVDRHRMTPGIAIKCSEVLGCSVEDLLIENHKWIVDARKLKELPLIKKYSRGEISKITGIALSDLNQVFGSNGTCNVSRSTVERLALVLCKGEVSLILAE